MSGKREKAEEETDKAEKGAGKGAMWRGGTHWPTAGRGSTGVRFLQHLPSSSAAPDSACVPAVPPAHFSPLRPLSRGQCRLLLAKAARTAGLAEHPRGSLIGQRDSFHLDALTRKAFALQPSHPPPDTLRPSVFIRMPQSRTSFACRNTHVHTQGPLVLPLFRPAFQPPAVAGQSPSCAVTPFRSRGHGTRHSNGAGSAVRTAIKPILCLRIAQLSSLPIPTHRLLMPHSHPFLVRSRQPMSVIAPRGANCRACAWYPHKL
jgi:hypothetical protein